MPSGCFALTEGQCAEIKRLRAEDAKLWTYHALAKKFSVSHVTILHIINGDNSKRQRRPQSLNELNVRTRDVKPSQKLDWRKKYED